MFGKKKSPEVVSDWRTRETYPVTADALRAILDEKSLLIKAQDSHDKQLAEKEEEWRKKCQALSRATLREAPAPLMRKYCVGTPDGKSHIIEATGYRESYGGKVFYREEFDGGLRIYADEDPYIYCTSTQRTVAEFPAVTAIFEVE